jgi:RimJ/RimL family protein N-acetyltransferase
VYGWTGEKTCLVPLDKERHFANALTWINDPELTAWMLVGDFPVARLAEEAWFENAMKQPPFGATDISFAVETHQGEHIGLCGIHKIDWRHGTGETGTLIGPQFRGQGYGRDTVRVRTRYAFEAAGLRLLLSQVFVENVASKRALLSAGYRETGVVPQRFWKRGAYRDMIQLALLREWWEKKPS